MCETQLLDPFKSIREISFRERLASFRIHYWHRIWKHSWNHFRNYVLNHVKTVSKSVRKHAEILFTTLSQTTREECKFEAFRYSCFLTGLALIKFQVEEYHTTCTTCTTLYWCSLSLCSSCFSVIAWRSIPDDERSLPTCPVDCWSVGEAIMSRLRRRLAPTLVRARRSPRRRSLRWGLATGRWP